jgi:hypothetical protein
MAGSEQVLKTTMSCQKCVAKVKPRMEAAGIADHLRFDMASPDKLVKFIGSDMQRATAVGILNELGYEVKTDAPSSQESSWQIYKPLALVAAFLVGVTFLVEIRAGSWSFMRALDVFMGAFFLTFSFFKFLDLEKFADAFQTYDVIAKRSRGYAVFYPFIELGLGILFILAIAPTFVNLATIVVLGIGTIGVVQAIRQKRQIECACLGTVFKLPMTKVTIFENSLMIVMAVASLIAQRL